jgi:hypothetical protein
MTRAHSSPVSINHAKDGDPGPGYGRGVVMSLATSPPPQLPGINPISPSIPQQSPLTELARLLARQAARDQHACTSPTDLDRAPAEVGGLRHLNSSSKDLT